MDDDIAALKLDEEEERLIFYGSGEKDLQPETKQIPKKKQEFKSHSQTSFPGSYTLLRIDPSEP